MAALSLVISIIALVIAYLAYTKAGGSTDDLRRKVDDLHLTTEGIRSKLADVLETIEKRVRGEEKKSGAAPDNKSKDQQNPGV